METCNISLSSRLTDCTEFPMKRLDDILILAFGDLSHESTWNVWDLVE